MAENNQDCLLPRPSLPVSDELLGGFKGHKIALALSMMGAGIAALFVFAHWSIALVGAAVILVLSAWESEPFILSLIFLTPLAGSLNMAGRLHDVPSAVRSLATVGFFLSRLWCGRLGLRPLLRSSPARGSLFFLGAITASVIFVKGGWTEYSSNSLYRTGSYVGFFFLVLAWADSPGRVKKILSVLLGSTIITALFAILQQAVGGYTSLWLYLHPSDTYFWEWAGRSTSFLPCANCLAGYLNLVLPLAIACYVLGQGKWKKLGGWTVGLGFVGLLSTQSLGGLLGFVSVLLLATFCLAPSRKRKLVLVAGTCALGCKRSTAPPGCRRRT